MEKILELDRYLFSLINGKWHTGFLDLMMPLITNKYTWIPVYIFLFYLILKSFKVKNAVIAISCLLLSVLVSDRVTSGLIKPTIFRPRPCKVEALHARIIIDNNGSDAVPCSDSGSFPSSHAANHFAIAVFMILLFSIKKNHAYYYLWLFWAFAISWSRVYVGVHYPGDVIGGGIIGIITGFACFNLNLLLQKRFAS
ncbi:MAG: phosphatase PAP2 family protein [Bacteroidia bacterium]|nr:phosphatase PAP2 family protein [Bacteroidia bacterium]